MPIRPPPLDHPSTLDRQIRVLQIDPVIADQPLQTLDEHPWVTGNPPQLRQWLPLRLAHVEHADGLEGDDSLRVILIRPSVAERSVP